MASSSPAELERRIVRLGERAHAEAQDLRDELVELRRTVAAGMRDIADSPALAGAAFAIAAAVGVWQGMRRGARRQGSGRATPRARH